MSNCCESCSPANTSVAVHVHGDAGQAGFWKENAILVMGMVVIFGQQLLSYGFQIEIPKYWALLINGVAYVWAGKEVLRLAWRKASRGDFFNEFVLMSVATLGAFYLGEYTEGLAVMVFYAIGEWFQDRAVKKAKGNIKALLDARPDEVELLRQGEWRVVPAGEVKIGDKIRVKVGEKVGLDGVLLSPTGTFNTAALTGESKPDLKSAGEGILAGMINLHSVVEIEVNTLFQDSKLSQILGMVEEASTRKSQTQLFISKFAKVYTPIVFFLAFSLVALPYFFVKDYVFQDWLYRGLVFLVISCPCALVVSIPLGYFGGIGLASKLGILIKGGNYLDALTQIQVLVSDKTGTLTWGKFEVQAYEVVGMSDSAFFALLGAIEAQSTHPIAQAILNYSRQVSAETVSLEVQDVTEIAGKGLQAKWNGQVVYVGKLELLKENGISYPATLAQKKSSLVVMGIDSTYVGYVEIADEIKANAAHTISELKALGIPTWMLSGDKQAVVSDVAKQLQISHAYGDLLPADKLRHVESLKASGKRFAFVGDGINDAPVLALADVGIAMGGLGSDAAIETADVVIQNDDIGKIVQAIKVAKLTRSVVWQNIVLAMGVKLLVLALGAGGLANLWEAVIADVGVALLAILNAVRIQRSNV